MSPSDPDVPAEAASRLAPEWLRRAVTLLVERADVVPPPPDNREDLPEFIYRH